MKYKWRRICAITGMIALCLFTPDIAEGNRHHTGYIGRAPPGKFRADPERKRIYCKVF